MVDNGFLGVAASVTGRRWVGPTADQDRLARSDGPRHRAALANLPDTRPARCTAPEASAFLTPALRDLLPDPRSLLDMERAALRCVQALKRREKIAIFADYDVDGGASAALLLAWLRAMNHDATLYIPDRIDEGYGPNDAAMTKLADQHDLIVCVDCGTLSHGPIEAAQSADVVVLDHHLGGETLPPAHSVVNPNRQDETGDLAHLCAAGVVFMMLVEANRQMRQDGVKGPDLMSMLDLVALATVADVAPLIGLNRAFVRTGLQVMARRKRIGLAALADVARMDAAPTSYHLGFLLGPRVNAGGRIGAGGHGCAVVGQHRYERGTRLGGTSRPTQQNDARSRGKSEPPRPIKWNNVIKARHWFGRQGMVGTRALSASSQAGSRKQQTGLPS